MTPTEKNKIYRFENGEWSCVPMKTIKDGDKFRMNDNPAEWIAIENASFKEWCEGYPTWGVTANPVEEK